MLDHRYAMARDRGNTGRNLAVGVMDTGTDWRHTTVMVSLVRAVVPDAGIYVGGWTPAELGRLVRAGACAVAMPFVFPSADPPAADWEPAFAAAAANGVLLFGGVGNGVETTRYPAASPSVFACGAVDGAGKPMPRGTSAAGKLEIGVLSGEHLSSGASCLAMGMACQWLGYGVRMFGPAQDRMHGFRAWLSKPSTPRGDRGAAVPDCGDL